MSSLPCMGFLDFSGSSVKGSAVRSYTRKVSADVANSVTYSPANQHRTVLRLAGDKHSIGHVHPEPRCQCTASNRRSLCSDPDDQPTGSVSLLRIWSLHDAVLGHSQWRVQPSAWCRHRSLLQWPCLPRGLRAGILQIRLTTGTVSSRRYEARKGLETSARYVLSGGNGEICKHLHRRQCFSNSLAWRNP